VRAVREPPERLSSAPTREGPAEAAVQLAWLAPDAVSLSALCRAPSPSPWSQVRHDPGAVLLLLRSAEPTSGIDPTSFPFPRGSTRIHDPSCFLEALRLLALAPAGFVDWNQPLIRDVYRTALHVARRAYHLAREVGRCDPEDAWVCGLLAPLGWLALCAADPAAVVSCLADPAYSSDPLGTQRRRWGLDHHAIASRLALRWRLPDVVAATAGRLLLPVRTTVSLGANQDLLHVVRVAAGHTRSPGVDLVLVPPEIAAESAAALKTSLSDERIEPPRVEGEIVPAGWQNPYQQPWLSALLALAAENRRLQNRVALDRLERERDVLHQALVEQRATEADRLRAAKLEALAELAAGAGHEVNNPLAVISGQAQYLLGHEADWFRDDPEGRARRALHAIIAQTRRIHGLLRDLMQFARPASPQPAWVDLPGLLGDVAAPLRDLAAQRGVRVEVQAGSDPLPVPVDADQVRVALACLVRNAIEAAPADGWARLVLEPATGDRVEVAVEDNGPGPEPANRENLFDPFFSGRTAGRGKGLGLPVAWRLARLQGGDVYLDLSRPGGPTRFILSLPRTAEPAGGVTRPQDAPANGTRAA
jgi:signal transduction histidine kinase